MSQTKLITAGILGAVSLAAGYFIRKQQTRPTRKYPTVIKAEIPELKLLYRGKVRDVYEVDENSLLFVATDRLSCFDVVMVNGVPCKGKVLTQMTLWWFKYLEEKVGCKTHLITGDIDEMPAVVRKHASFLRGRVMLVKKLKMLPVESICRGYITGGGYKEYKAKGSVCGVQLPADLEDCEQLPNVIWTPSTKEEYGTHDENITKEQAIAKCGALTINDIESLSVKYYKAAFELAKSRGVILADTKFEFGMDGETLVLADEILTPDSSRYWNAAIYQKGRQQDSLDKQYVRNYLLDINFDKATPAVIPDYVLDRTVDKYLECFRTITGEEPEL